MGEGFCLANKITTQLGAFTPWHTLGHFLATGNYEKSDINNTYLITLQHYSTGKTWMPCMNE